MSGSAIRAAGWSAAIALASVPVGARRSSADVPEDADASARDAALDDPGARVPVVDREDAVV
jgi:hypothetical protein